jgi:hypothetical protein
MAEKVSRTKMAIGDDPIAAMQPADSFSAPD